MSHNSCYLCYFIYIFPSIRFFFLNISCFSLYSLFFVLENIILSCLFHNTDATLDTNSPESKNEMFHLQNSFVRRSHHHIHKSNQSNNFYSLHAHKDLAYSGLSLECTWLYICLTVYIHFLRGKLFINCSCKNIITF